MAKFRKTYRVESTRLPGFDYSAPGYYFLTICTHGRACWFGEIRSEFMLLNDAGCIAWQEWYRTGELRPNIRLDEFIVMPNHIHAIIQILEPSVEKRGVSTISAIINQYKMVVTKRVRQTHPEFAWQSRFYDHIVRDEQALRNLREYILYNPAMWKSDEMYAARAESP